MQVSQIVGTDFQMRMKEVEEGPLKDRIDKLYIRIIMDDDEDSYTTERYAKFVKHGGNITFADLG